MKKNENDRWDYYTTGFRPKAFCPSLVKANTERNWTLLIPGLALEPEPTLNIQRTHFINRLLLLL